MHVAQASPDTFIVPSARHLSLEWFQRDPTIVAAELVSCTMHMRIRRSEEHDIEQWVRMRIVETEAYLSKNDAACHAATGRSSRNAPMFEDGGVLYVYKIYGVHYCANIVTELAGQGSAVLLRAARCEEGEDILRSHRPGVKDHELARGPGNLCRALGLDLGHNLHSCNSEDLYFTAVAPECAPPIIMVGPRIGISKAVDLPLRFFEASESAVSAHRRAEVYTVPGN